MEAFGHDNPSMLLGMLQDQKQQAQVVQTHARWDSSESHYAAYWLALASRNEGFDEIVRARLKLDPEDVLTLRAEQDARKDLRSAVCKRHRALANAHPESINFQYVAARCVDDDAQREQEFAALYAKAPHNGWVAAAMGYMHAGHGHWSDALAALNTARAQVPAMTERFALDTMRLRRMLSRDGDVSSNDLAQQSNTLQYYLSLVSGAGLQPGSEMAYHRIARGELNAAVNEPVQNPQEAARILRLAAASDGASRQIVERALALPMDQGFDADTMWVALGLALRERRDPAPYVAAIRENKDDNAEKMLQLDQPGRCRAPARRTAARSAWRGLQRGARDPGISCAGRMASGRRSAAVRTRAAVFQQGDLKVVGAKARLQVIYDRLYRPVGRASARLRSPFWHLRAASGTFLLGAKPNDAGRFL
jgi:hypothetical protein